MDNKFTNHEWQHIIARAEKIPYGEVKITLHNGKISLVEFSEKVKFDIPKETVV